MRLVADSMDESFISDNEFQMLKDFFYSHSGIMLGANKKSFIQNRLQKRLNALNCRTYTDYYKYITAPGHEAELEKVINLLTTNETYFFREIAHFDFLQKNVLKSLPSGATIRFWSAASSTGEEAYSLSMLLADHKPHSSWEVLGTDLNSDVVNTAQKGLYPMARLESVPPDYLKKYFLKGKGKFQGYVLMDQPLRARVNFIQMNLMGNKIKNTVGMFDVVFLRNVMIYFNLDERKKIISNVTECIRPGGWLFIGHSESLMGVTHGLIQRGPSIYQRPKDV